jgi:DNA-binding transcriptional MerR regulator
LAPRRTSGGYRLYSQADVERLRAILRMQRDEFLPLRVIRQELATGDFGGADRRGANVAVARRAASVDAPVQTLTQEELLEQAGVAEELLRELGEFGIVQPQRRDGRLVYDETDLEIVRAAGELSRFGVAGRNLRVFRTSADREAALLEQLVGAALRSRSQARRKEAVENLESLAGICGHLKHLLLVRDLRRLKGE